MWIFFFFFLQKVDVAVQVTTQSNEQIITPRNMHIAHFEETSKNLVWTHTVTKEVWMSKHWMCHYLTTPNFFFLPICQHKLKVSKSHMAYYEVNMVSNQNHHIFFIVTRYIVPYFSSMHKPSRILENISQSQNHELLFVLVFFFLSTFHMNLGHFSRKVHATYYIGRYKWRHFFLAMHFTHSLTCAT